MEPLEKNKELNGSHDGGEPLEEEMEESSEPNGQAEPTSLSHDSLFCAAERGDEEAVRALLENCGDIEAMDKAGFTALHRACENGHHRIAKLLMDNGASIHTTAAVTGQTALHLTSQFDWEDTAAFLLRRGADVRAVDDLGKTALHDAASGDNESMVKLFLSYGADIDALNHEGETPLTKACMSGSSNVAKVLIESGANVHSVCDGIIFLNNYERDLHFAARSYSLLHFAASRSTTEIMQLLLDLKAIDVDVLDKNGRTPLHEACNIFQLNAAKCLLENGASVSYPCRTDGSTALHLAARTSMFNFLILDEVLDVVKLLFKYKADVNAENKKGQTPFGCALGSVLSGPGINRIHEFFVKQLVRMKEQNLFISEKNLEELSQNVKVMSFSASCRDEIERMKKRMIGNSRVKIYDIFTKGVDHLAYYMCNENVELALESENYKAEFPIYASEIHEMFLQAKERRDLLRQSNDLLFTVINEFYELPRVLVERISGYLTNAELALH